MHVVVVILHILACLTLILVVLLQTGKGADLGAAFGGSSQTVFGSQGAGGFLAKLTTGMAVVFMLTSLSLAYLSTQRVQSTIMAEPEQAAAVAEPGLPEGTPADEMAAEAPEATAAPATQAAPAAAPAAGETTEKSPAAPAE